MGNDLEKIVLFLEEHHVMSLATTDFKNLSVCSLFYAYSKEKNSFIVASSEDTVHMQHIQQNARVAGNILLETKTVGKIQGVQFHGKFTEVKEKNLEKLYFKMFPYALALSPALWQIRVEKFKMTNNLLGFGKKLIWERERPRQEKEFDTIN